MVRDAAGILAQIGFEDVAHTDRTLSAHLIGTAGLLSAWSCPESVVLAGLIHSVYGTDYFRRQSVDPSDRGRVRSIVGVEAEHLAYQGDHRARRAGARRPGPHRGGQPARAEPRLSEDRRFARKAELAALRPYLRPAARAALDEAYDFPAQP